MDAGTAVIMLPFGMVMLAFTVATPRMLQFWMAIVSAAPALSVNVTVTGGADEVEQGKPASFTVTEP